MIASAAAFVALLPEFARVEAEIVNDALAEAAAQTDPEVFGDLTDAAHKWLTAHILATSPSGRDTRATFTDAKGGDISETGETIYSVRRRNLENLVGAAWIATVDEAAGDCG
jgi:hypothetical protein